LYGDRLVASVDKRHLLGDGVADWARELELELLLESLGGKERERAMIDAGMDDVNLVA
jgi:hypothetical protein